MAGINYTKAISEVTQYRNSMASVRDMMNKGTAIPPEAMPTLGKDYERIICPYATAVGLSEPGEHTQHGYTFKYNNPVELAVKDWQFFHLNKAVQFLNLLIGRLEHHSESETGLNAADTSSRPFTPTELSVLRTLAERSISTKSNTIDISIDGLRLLALINQSDISQLPAALSHICKNAGHIKEYSDKDLHFHIILSDKLNIPKSLDTNSIERIQGNLIKRTLLFYLYERYKEAHHLKAGMTPLVPLAPILGVSEAHIQLYGQQLIDDGFTEYAVMDGGQYTCNLTRYGAQIARDTAELLSEFPTIDLSISQKEDTMKKEKIQPIDPQKVFVVHGRNNKAREAMFTFLRAIGLEPIEWEEAVKMTNHGSPYIGDVLDVAFNQAQAIVVLFTGDDLAKLNDNLLAEKEQAEDLTPQPRPNVLFEAGMALGRNPTRTIIVESGELRSISDLVGRHAIRINNTPAKRQVLADRLRTAGCAVRLEGKTDWHTAGDFETTPLKSNTSNVTDTHDNKETAFNDTLILKLADAHEIFSRDYNTSIPQYLTLVSDPVSSSHAINIFERWDFIARAKAGMSTTPAELTNQILSIINTAIRAVNATSNLPKKVGYSTCYGQLTIRFNEFAADLEKYLKATKSLHGCDILIPRLPHNL